MEDEDKKLIVDYFGSRASIDTARHDSAESGDGEALAKLVERNLGLIYRYAFRLARDAEDAQDITQETFVKLWRNIRKFDLNKNFRTWLLGIAHNTAIDLLRKRREFVFSDFDNESGDFSETLADPAPLPPEIFARAEQKKLLDNALGQLSPASREILTLYHEEDFTFAEIGAILNKPLNTVKSQYRRALLMLRRILLE